MTRIDLAIQAHVDTQLIEAGAYTTLELLISTGRLSYGDYESWRRGEIEFLDDVLMGVREKIQAQIEEAAAYAAGIGLVVHTQEFHLWATQPGDDTKALRSSADPALHRLIAARFVPAQSAPQMDLFFDNPVVALTNGIARALAARNLAEAQRQLDRLYAQAPNHADLAAFDRLTAALARLDQPIADAGQTLTFCLEITPTARRLLGSQARDLLTPLWLRLADALNGRAYSDDAPNLHRSFALSQAQEWAGVAASILAEPEWHRHAPLCLRLTHAGFYRQQRIQALMAWYHLCWRHPDQATHALDSREQRDAGIAATWTRFQDSDEGDHDIAPSTGDFPAWMLLQEQGLALQLPLDLPTASSPGEERYREVHRWIHARRAQHHDEELTLRRALKASSPFLFRFLKRMVSA